MMNKKRALIAVAVTTAVLALPSLSVIAQQDDDEPPEMGFFVTSTTKGDGGNLGGLAGADAHCQSLAQEHCRGALAALDGVELAPCMRTDIRQLATFFVEREH